MKTLKEAWTLIKFEYKMIPPSYVSALSMLAIAVFLVVSTFTNAEDGATMGTEMFFITIVVAFPYVIRSEQMRPKNIGNKEHTSPMVVFLQFMPISKKVIAIYRLLSYVGIILIFNSAFFTLFYTFSPYIRSVAPLSTYIVFSVMWMCFAIYFGGMQVNIEAGYHSLTYWFFTILVWFPLVLISILVLFYKVYTKGLIQWMLDLSSNHPIIVVGASIILAISGFLFHIRGFMKRIEKVDY